MSIEALLGIYLRERGGGVTDWLVKARSLAPHWEGSLHSAGMGSDNWGLLDKERHWT